MERKLSTILGLLIGGMWMGEILLGNLGGTSVFGNLRDVHPRVYAMAGWFALQRRFESVSGVDYSAGASCS
jgi:hypothetical protein